MSVARGEGPASGTSPATRGRHAQVRKRPVGARRDASGHRRRARSPARWGGPWRPRSPAELDPAAAAEVIADAGERPTVVAVHGRSVDLSLFVAPVLPHRATATAGGGPLVAQAKPPK